jgi:hypothetical protein
MIRTKRAATFALLAVATAVASVSVLSLATATAPDDRALWLAQSRGVTRAAAETGAANFEIPVQTGARAVAADGTRGTVWVLGQQALLTYDRTGGFLFQTELSGPLGGQPLLAVDAANGLAWLALHSQVRAYGPAGEIRVQRDLAKPFSAAALDGRRSHFWVAFDDTLEAFEETGQVAASWRMTGVKAIPAMAYAPESDRVWVLADDSLRQLAPDGAPTTVVAHDRRFKDFTAIAPDGSGGLWAIDKQTLYALDASGTVVRGLRPFRGESPELLTGLAADPTDGSVWVASQRGLAHIRTDGSIRVKTTPDPGDGKTRLIQSLHLETAGKPRIQILEPANGALLDSARPSLRLSYTGVDLDLSSIVITDAGDLLPVTCTALPGTANCIPDAPLADGVHDLTATIASRSGDVSEPATLRITIDTTPPTITVTQPQQNFLTNQSSLTLSGQLSEPAALTVNGVPAPIQNLQFSFGPVTLAEGGNSFTLLATDPAGNFSTVVLSGVLDTVPPSAPVSDRIQITVSGGQINVTGGSGSVESGALVTLINLRTGEQVTVTANAEGGFSAALTGSVGDELRIHATDAAGNNGQAVTIAATGSGPFGGPINISALSPANGSTVFGDIVRVTLDLQAPPNTGVMVNDVVAAAVPGPSGLRFHALVPLQTGSNTLNVEVHAQDGRVVTRTINITSSGPFPYRLVANRAVGVAPLELEFEVLDQLGRGIFQVQVDFDNNGSVDHVSDGTAPIAHTFIGEGLRQARVIVFDSSGQGHVQMLNVVLLSPAVIDQSIQAMWQAMNDALVAGDKEGALRFLSHGAREQYGPIFEVLLPQMPQIVASYSPFQQSLVYGAYAEYGVNRIIDGIDRVFLIGLVTNEFGQWQVESM